jgi:muramidase (phage lysozyme)
MPASSLAPNLAAFLDMLAWSEIGPQLLAKSDNGYNVLVGSTPDHPILFADYSTHPQIHNAACKSDAAGRYQEMGKYWSHYKLQLSLPDFGPNAQDRWAVQLIKECHALDDILLGHIEKAIEKCRSRWASLPAAGYGQRENTLADLQAAYERAGGLFA